MAARRKSTQMSRKAALAQAATLATPELFRTAAELIAAAQQMDEYLVHGRVPPAVSAPVVRMVQGRRDEQ
jgi:hypothetical protein